MSPIFTRDLKPSPWNSRDPASPHPDYTRREFYVLVLTSALPLYLKRCLVRRFLEREPLALSATPPALPSLTRQPYAPGEVGRFDDGRLCNEITIEAQLLERTLSAPAGLVSGLSYNHLLAVHIIRLRQLWEEFSRRRWPDG